MRSNTARRLFVLLLLCLLPSFAVSAPGDPRIQIPLQSHAPTGLAFDGTYFWVADRLSDSLYAVHPTTGEFVKKMPSPGYITRGLAWDGKHLWCVDQEEKRIYKLDIKTQTTIHSIESPTASIQGLAWDGSDLWLSDDREDVICKISTVDGTTIERFPAPCGKSTGLTWLNGYLWCADRQENRIYMIDPEHNGEVVLSIDTPGEYCRGLATDGTTLWCVDYQDDKLVQLTLDDGTQYVTSNSHTLNLELIHEFRNYGPGAVEQLNVFIALPENHPNQKLVISPRFSPSKFDLTKDRWDLPVAHFKLTNFELAKRNRITMNVTAELSDVRWFVFPDKVGSLNDIPKEIKKTYLVDEDKYRIHDKRIQKAVKEAVGSETNPYWMMRAIHKYIRDRLHYELSGGWNVAPRVLERGNGSCSEYTFLFISMCRAAGIPARYVGSVVIRGEEASTDDVFHRWSQVYLPNYGWIHVDPQGGDKSTPAKVAESIGTLSNRFLLTTFGGGASDLLGWNYNYDQHWTSKGPVKIHVETIGEWSPVKAK